MSAPQSLPFHRLSLLDPRHRWWSPLGGLLLTGLLYLALNLVMGLAWGAIRVQQGRSMAPTIGPNGYPEGLFQHPTDFFFLFASIAMLLPSVLLARLCFGPRPLGLLFSVVGRLRWGWMLRCLLCALVVLVALQFGLGSLLPQDPGTAPALSAGHGSVLAMILLLVPLQAAAEECVFRGQMMQALGRWLRHPAWAVVLPVPLFVLGHGYEGWGLASVGVLALASGFLAVATGGLEAGIALHAVNNGLALLVGWVGAADTFGQTGTTGLDVALSVLVDLVYVLLVLWAARRRRTATTAPVPPAQACRPRPRSTPR